MTETERNVAAARLYEAHKQRECLMDERNYWMKRAGMMAVCAVIGWAAFTAMICWAMGRAP